MTWKDIKWKDLAAGGGLVRGAELVGGETKSFPVPVLPVWLFLRGRKSTFNKTLPELQRFHTIPIPSLFE